MLSNSVAHTKVSQRGKGGVFVTGTAFRQPTDTAPDHGRLPRVLGTAMHTAATRVAKLLSDINNLLHVVCV